MLTESWNISVSRPNAPDIIIIACPQIPINRKYFTVYVVVIKFHFLTQSLNSQKPQLRFERHKSVHKLSIFVRMQKHS